MKRNLLSFIISISVILISLSLISCGDKALGEEKKLEHIQKIYNKKGIKEFIKKVEKEHYFPVKDFEKDEATPLLIAVESMDFETAKFFLDKGASVDEKDMHGRDLIDYALKSNDVKTMDFAINVMPSAYWNLENSDGVIPLIKFIKNCNDFNIIKKVHDLTENKDFTDVNGKTLLMYAAQCNINVQIVKLLLDNGSDIDIKNNNEWTALMYAARYNPNPAVLEDLILRGADTQPNSVGLTVTMLASCNKNPGVLFTLLQYKNEINCSTDQGKTALMYACENKQDSTVIKMLIDNDADLNAKDLSGKTVREYLSANTSLSTSDIAIAWKSAEETVITDSVETKTTENELPEEFVGDNNQE